MDALYEIIANVGAWEFDKFILLWLFVMSLVLTGTGKKVWAWLSARIGFKPKAQSKSSNGNGVNPTITDAMSIASQVQSRLDEHEEHCDERQRVAQAQLDRRFNGVDKSVDGVKHRLETLETDVGEMKSDLGEIKGYIKGTRDANRHE